MDDVVEETMEVDAVVEDEDDVESADGILKGIDIYTST